MFNPRGRLNFTGTDSAPQGPSAFLNSSLSNCTLVAVILAALVQIAQGQEALRTSLAGEEAAALRRNVLESQTGNLQLGLTSFQVGGSLGIEWNDNVAYSDVNQQQDVILRPAFSLGVSRPLTEQNGLYASLDLGYAKYIHLSQYDRLLIAPGTQLTFDTYFKDFHFNVHDYAALTEQPVAFGTISDTGNFGEFSNLAGLGVDWDLNELIASLGYDHQTTIATTSAYSYLNENSENFVARATFQPSQAWSGGPEASAAFTSYEYPVLSDSQNYSLGGFVAWEPGTHFHGSFRAGYTWFFFKSPPNQSPVPDTSSYYFDANLSDRLNDVIALSVDAGRQIRRGVNSDLLDLWYAYPVIDWHIFEKIHLDTHLTFENGIESGNSVLSANERYTLLGGGIGMGYHLMEKLLLTWSYDYTVKDSNLAGRDYHQNKVQLQIQLTF
jgi:hypothetical protein